MKDFAECAGQSWYEEMVAAADERAYQVALAEGKADNSEWELLQEEALVAMMLMADGIYPLGDEPVSGSEAIDVALRATGWLPADERYPGWQMPKDREG